MNRVILIFLSGLVLVPPSLWAETGATCVSVTDSTVGDAAGGAVLVMVAVMIGMFTALGLFVLKLARGARQTGSAPVSHPTSPEPLPSSP